MENELLKTIVNNGAWAVLFVWLLMDTRKESEIREEKLQGIIDFDCEWKNIAYSVMNKAIFKFIISYFTNIIFILNFFYLLLFFLNGLPYHYVLPAQEVSL